MGRAQVPARRERMVPPGVERTTEKRFAEHL